MRVSLRLGLRHTPLVCAILASVACGATNVTTPSSGNNNSGSSGNGSGSSGATGPGLSWRAVSQPFSTYWRSVAYGNGTFIAVGDFHKAYSADGTSWTSYNYTSTSLYEGDNLMFANGIFMSVTGTYVQTTTGGTTWSVVNIAGAQATNGAQNLAGLTYGNSRWVAVDDRFLTEDRLAFFTSTDNGAHWTQTITGIGYQQPTGIAFGNGVYVAVGYGGLVATSPDGTAWTKRSFGNSSDFGVLNVQFLNTAFYAVTNAGGIFRSSDGISWTHIQVGVNALASVAYGSGVYVAVGSASALASSPDGISWTQRTWPGVHNNFESVTFGNGAFVGVGDSAFGISP